MERINAELLNKIKTLEQRNAELTTKNGQFERTNTELNQQLSVKGGESSQKISELAKRNGDLSQQVAELTQKATEHTTVITDLTRNKEEASRRITELSQHSQESEQQVVQLSMRTNEFSQRLSALEQELEQQKAARAALQEQLDDVLDARERDRWYRAVTDISAGKDSLEMFLSQLDNPTNLGNAEASASIVVEDVSSLSKFATRLVDVARSGNDADPAISQKELYGALNAVGNALRSLFMDAKGASRGLDDGTVSQKLRKGARQVGVNALSLLETLRMQGGQPHADEDPTILSDGMQTLLV